MLQKFRPVVKLINFLHIFTFDFLIVVYNISLMIAKEGNENGIKMLK